MSKKCYLIQSSWRILLPTCLLHSNLIVGIGKNVSWSTGQRKLWTSNLIVNTWISDASDSIQDCHIYIILCAYCGMLFMIIMTIIKTMSTCISSRPLQVAWHKSNIREMNMLVLKATAHSPLAFFLFTYFHSQANWKGLQRSYEWGDVQGVFWSWIRVC